MIPDYENIPELVCPICGSYNIDWIRYPFNSWQDCYDCDCRECGESWVEEPPDISEDYLES